MKKELIVAVLLILAVLFTACSNSDTIESADEDSGTFSDSPRDDSGESSTSSYEETTEEMATVSEAPAGEASLKSDSADGMAYEDAADAGIAAEEEILIDSDIDIIDSQYNEPEPAAGQLTAGEWNDNENWDFWVNLINDNSFYGYYDQWGIDTIYRIACEFTNNQRPFNGLRVELMDIQDNTLWTSITDAQGKAYLFTNDPITEGVVKVYNGEMLLETYSVSSSDNEIYDELYVEDTSTRVEADIMFVVDTTGSMGDELGYLQEEIKDVITTVSQENANIPINLSVNYYRDYGDEYLVRPFEFTTDIDEVVSQISEQEAYGGGDYEEAVDEALYNGIYSHEWSKDSTTKILFLVLDAPPHYSDETVEIINELIIAASELGIKIIPIASSGIDEQTEVLLRCMAIATNGTYTFLTDDSGVGNSHLEPTIGDYDVEYLNEMLVRIISEYI